MLKFQTRFHKIMSGLLIFALLAPATPLAAAEQTTAGKIQDVELHSSGMLASRVVDLQGEPVANAEVTVQYEGRTIATATSDSDGYVAVKGLRPGVHSIHTTSSSTICRFWSENTAPPSAVRIPAVVSDGEVVRGQFGAFNLPMLVYAGVSAAALFIAIDAEDNADDANDKIAALEQRVEALEAASP
ncbi:MAG: carboxypeptidase regulatory-like domain-containing protein [Planctomyces sp.]|nr:carboxypeptidase regulatory-like domain-containing protein [Planctomyces sp.]